MTASALTTLADEPDDGHADDVAFLAAFARDLANPRDLPARLDTVLAGIAGRLGAQAAALFLVDEPTQELVCHASLGPLDLHGVRVRPGKGILGRCLGRNTLEAVHEPGYDPELIGALGRSKGFITRAAACAPMAAEGRLLGAIQVANRQRRGGFNQHDRHLLQAMANAAALAVANAHMAEELVRREVTARELDLAAEIQRNLLPKVEPGAFPVFGLNRPIRQVSGDFFDFFRLPDQRVAFALGDVAGKGINAALLMAKAASLFRCLGKQTDDPSAILSTVNSEIHETASRGMFVTMVAGTYDPSSGRLHFANAGHEPPLLRRPDHSYQTFPAEAPPLGILPRIEVPAREVDLAGGEFYIFSDGLVEFRYGKGEQLGVHGLIQMVEGLSDLALDERLKALLSELDREGWRLRDDLTVLAIDDAWVRRHG